uniref:Putative secreted protein n=1 Tax=Anopheles darlingi TaxID=43151 RepID=A0A2M4D080_ANODA
MLADNFVVCSDLALMVLLSNRSLTHGKNVSVLATNNLIYNLFPSMRVLFSLSHLAPLHSIASCSNRKRVTGNITVLYVL